MKRKRKSPRRHSVKSHIRDGYRVSNYVRGKGTRTLPTLTARRRIDKPKSFTVNFTYSNRKGYGESVVVISTSYDKALKEAFEEKTDFPDCKSMIREFYAGNVVVGPFPFSRYVQYFQFGVVSSRSIANNRWSVDLRDPRLLRETGWDFVDVAWSIEGDISYLDYSWMWGGSPYLGVSAQYYRNTLENPYEVIFFYNGQTLPTGTVLWQCRNSNQPITAADSLTFTQLTSEVFGNYALSFSICILAIIRIHAETYALDRLGKARAEKERKIVHSSLRARV